MPFVHRKLAWLTILGPGLVVMLADTDAGSLILAAQSGALWGYKLLVWQIILIPVLFIVQELTVRLGLATQMGHGELIKHHFGKGWAWISVLTLVVCCAGALLTEFSGLVSVGVLFGISAKKVMVGVVSFLVLIAWTGSYRSVERVAIFLGLFEVVFIWVAIQSKPVIGDALQSSLSMPLHDTSYLYMIAGNIGAVIMPWMIFFQQSAILDKGLSLRDLRTARWDTAVGAVITQIIMISMMVITAATVGKINPNTSLDSVSDISQAITPVIGYEAGRILFALGMTGAALVATIVVSLTAAWGIGEVLGFRRSLEDHPSKAPTFYGIYTLILILSAWLVTSNKVNLVKLSVGVEVMNAFLLPFVLGFLYLLARKALPEPYRLKGKYGVCVLTVLVLTSGFGVLFGILGSL